MIIETKKDNRGYHDCSLGGYNNSSALTHLAGDATKDDDRHNHNHNGMQFSTNDQDHDTHSSSNCAFVYGAGWNHQCHNFLLTGDYSYNGACEHGKCIHWKTLITHTESLKSIVMMTRRKHLK